MLSISRRLPVVLCLLAGLSVGLAAQGRGPAGAGPRTGQQVMAGGDTAIVTMIRARKTVEAVAALGFLLYLLGRSRRPWTARRRVVAHGAQAPTLSSFSW